MADDVLILGCGRSGTSLVAGCLASAGYNFGPDPFERDCFNPRGYFESQSVIGLNEEILARVFPSPLPADSSAPNREYWLACVPRTANIRASSCELASLRTIIKTRPFCLKDPRFAYTLAAWRPLLDGAKFLCVFREPSTTAESIVDICQNVQHLRPVEMTFSRAVELWSTVYEWILHKHSQIGDWLFVNSRDIVNATERNSLFRFLRTASDASFAAPSLMRCPSQRSVPARAEAVFRELCARARNVARRA